MSDNSISCMTGESCFVTLYECGDARILTNGKTKRFTPSKRDYEALQRLVHLVNEVDAGVVESKKVGCK